MGVVLLQAVRYKSRIASNVDPVVGVGWVSVKGSGDFVGDDGEGLALVICKTRPARSCSDAVLKALSNVCVVLENTIPVTSFL